MLRHCIKVRGGDGSWYRMGWERGTTSADISSYGQQDPQSEDNPFVDSVQEADKIQEEEVFTEVARIIEDLENGIVDPTLARLGAGDVALDRKSTRLNSSHGIGSRMPSSA